LIYIFINCLFTYKYAFDYSLNPVFISIFYIIFFAVIYLIASGKIRIINYDSTRVDFYWYMVVAAAVALFVLMLQFDPARIAVGRYPALYDWIDRLFHGLFPYQSPTNPSGLPMLFILASPFYLLGDLGVFQIFSFLLFCFAVGYIIKEKSLRRLRYPLLLLCAPIFLYEIVVRSELFSNMVIVMVYLAVTIKYIGGARNGTLIILGLIGGLLLSTRVVVFLIYLVFLADYLRLWRNQYWWFIISMICGFVVTLIPFMLWDWNYFIHKGPFAVQALYAPIWLVIIYVVAAFVCGFLTRTTGAKLKAAAYLLFGIVMTAFVFAIAEYGWMTAVVGDKFDISYFCFSLPFLILGLDFPERPVRAS